MLGYLTEHKLLLRIVAFIMAFTCIFYCAIIPGYAALAESVLVMVFMSVIVFLGIEISTNAARILYDIFKLDNNYVSWKDSITSGNLFLVSGVGYCLSLLGSTISLVKEFLNKNILSEEDAQVAYEEAIASGAEPVYHYEYEDTSVFGFPAYPDSWINSSEPERSFWYLYDYTDMPADNSYIHIDFTDNVSMFITGTDGIYEATFTFGNYVTCKTILSLSSSYDGFLLFGPYENYVNDSFESLKLRYALYQNDPDKENGIYVVNVRNIVTTGNWNIVGGNNDFIGGTLSCSGGIVTIKVDNSPVASLDLNYLYDDYPELCSTTTQTFLLTALCLHFGTSNVGSSFELDIDLPTYLGDTAVPIPESDTEAVVLQIPQTDTQAESITSTNVVVKDVVAEVPTISTESGSLDFTPLSMAGGMLLNKFPFCLPFDLYNAFAGFFKFDDDEAPVIEIPIDLSEYGEYSIELDLSIFDDNIVLVVRYGFYCIFLLGLILVTKKIIT